MDQIPVTQLKGIGDKTKALLNKIGIYTISDLLYHFPRDYDTFKEPVPISELVVGQIQSIYVSIVGTINIKKIRNLTIVNVTVKDSTGMCQLTFFNMPFLKKILHPGSLHVFRGMIQKRGNNILIEQPKMYSYEDYKKQLDFLMPKYSLTKGLTNQSLQKAVKQALSLYNIEEEYFSKEFLDKHDLIGINKAVELMHFPENIGQALEARKRIVFNEFFDFCMLLQSSKEVGDNLSNNYRMFETADTVRFLEQIPFSLTKAQKKVWAEIKQDFEGKFVMNRLIQGDVGSGKTIVAILALLMCVANGYQGAFMAPTEVLATQHYDDINEYIQKFGLCFKPVLLVGSMTAKEKKEVYEKIESGECNLIIGTHALIQEKVNYKSLALVVTDEQHRFGVRQRKMLAEKGANPHVLVMSATPIPRTLAIILYGDLHISIIDELPSNRLPIKNCVVNTAYRPKAYEFIAKEVASGHQAYVVCPMVEEGEMDDLENVIDYTSKLKASLPASIQISYLHGKMKPTEKNRIMDEFSQGNIDVLVSTTVIEVGINVPNATVMMVENAERFGLAALHQLRGRVGRGESQSYCIFISTKDDKTTMERLNILNKSNDGFFIASEDLRLRGPGELFGVQQSGDISFKYGDIYTDSVILKEASEAVYEIINSDPNLDSPSSLKIKKHLEEQNINSVDFRSI